MASLIRRLEAVNAVLGRTVAWLALAMVLLQFAIVILRYVFSVGFIALQESVWYLHGLLFMLGAGYTLLRDEHVRIDVIYREASIRYRAWVDLLGVLLLLLPVCGAILWLSWNYVLNAWRTLEGSTELSGLPLIFLLKTVVLVFAVLLSLQGLALALRALRVLTGAGPER
ncbi:MAG: TRAP transporter small permease subunit [Candidatus Competibacterales bacterium]|nr:TRAP transporter small permease subunit [Candidatus Competibacterales bacterium]